MADQMQVVREEFAKYHRLVTGRDAPGGLVAFAIDPAVSRTGHDAYSIVSSPDGTAATITGSNLRSVFYGLYDLLERRAGCRWFWDGDIVPRLDAIGLSGLDIREEAHFEYRGIRYFAHRGLTRFQAEHWGPDEWRREIDWCLKRRLNVLMLRIGQDDLFQRAFPETCAYPDPSKPLPGAGRGYDDRSLFWSLEYRGELRRRIQRYAFARGLMMPEDFGTMTHWYSRTPEDFLERKNPPFLPNASGQYGERNGLVWDIRDDRWADDYWKMTRTAVEAYGAGAPRPRLLHTIGLGERRCYDDRKANFKLKKLALGKFLDRAHRDYPDAKVLLAGWDFYLTWEPDEIKALLPHLDPKRDIVWDYEGDENDDVFAPAKRGNNFTKWGLVGKFPYTFSFFLAYEKALDARANYPLIEERQRVAQNDPACVGYVLWPESSHTDTLALRFFTANAWSGRPQGHGEVLHEFCQSRYGSLAERMERIWALALPVSWLRGWGVTCADAILFLGSVNAHAGIDERRIPEWKAPVARAAGVFALLAEIPWEDEFVKRDTIDIARMVLDRTISFRIMELVRDIAAWRTGADGEGLGQSARGIAAFAAKLADILSLHTDFSLWESFGRLDAIEKVGNPDFTKTLFENASCQYCRSHQYELARWWYAPHAEAFAERLAAAVASAARTAELWTDPEPERLALKARALETLRPTLPRTAENFAKTMRAIADDGLPRAFGFPQTANH
ncbi:MAG: hypothetical protein IJK04_05365 [Kiritimatiellae bacterium]|nr:hypothetical protein [Kiritimatiellia bacterium]